MLIYLVLALIVYLFSAVVSYKNPYRSWWLPDLAVLALLILFSGTRLNVGTDYGAYHYIYNHVISPHFDMDAFSSTDQEVGYYLLSVVTKNLSSSPYGIFMSTSVMTILPVYAVLKKKSALFSMSMLLYILMGFYTTPFNVMRNGIAIAINFYATQYMDTSPRKYLALNLLACTFHITAAIAMVLQLGVKFWKVRPTVKLLAIAAGLAALSAAFITRIYVVLGFIASLNVRYLSYFEANQSGIGLRLMILLKIAVILYIMAMTKENDLMFEKTCLIISVVFMIIGTVNIPVARFAGYFDICLLLVIPSILASMDLKTRWLHQYGLTLIFVLQFVLQLFFYGGMIPYQTYLI